MIAWLWFYFGKPTNRLYWTRREARESGGGYGWALRRIRLPRFKGTVPPP